VASGPGGSKTDLTRARGVFLPLIGSQKLAKIAKISKIAKPSARPSNAKCTTGAP